MKKCKYKIYDNYTGETIETNNWKTYKIIIEELKETYTEKIHDKISQTIYIRPHYIMTIYNHEDGTQTTHFGLCQTK